MEPFSFKLSSRDAEFSSAPSIYSEFKRKIIFCRKKFLHHSFAAYIDTMLFSFSAVCRPLEKSTGIFSPFFVFVYSRSFQLPICSVNMSTEILNPLLSSWGIRHSKSSSRQQFRDQKFGILSRLLWGRPASRDKTFQRSFGFLCIA